MSNPSPNHPVERTAHSAGSGFMRVSVPVGRRSPGALGAAPVRVMEKRPLATVFGVALSRICKGGSHEYSTRSTVQPAEVPGWGDARGDGGAPWMATAVGAGRAAARD